MLLGNPNFVLYLPHAKAKLKQGDAKDHGFKVK